MSAFAVENVSIAFGGVKALQNISFAVEPGEIFAVIGPNGAGKTTLFNVVSGLYRPTQGRFFVGSMDVTGLLPHGLAARGLSRTFQNLQVFSRMSAIENVMAGRHLHERHGVLPHLFALPAVRRQNRATREKSLELLAQVGMENLADRRADSLAYGQLKRLEIARALATEPKVLLLDEPAAGCNAVETRDIDSIIQKVAASGVSVVLVEHDMRLVMKISHRIHVLDGGRTLAEGTSDVIRNNPAVIAAYLGGAARGEDAHARD